MNETQRIKLAWIIAAAADLLELVLFPAFIEGALSPVNDALDVLVAAAMVWLLGWHWAFLPTFMAEMVPVIGLVPTWSAAVFLVTRGRTPTTTGGDGPIDVRPQPPRLDDGRGPRA